MPKCPCQLAPGFGPVRSATHDIWFILELSPDKNLIFKYIYLWLSQEYVPIDHMAILTM